MSVRRRAAIWQVAQVIGFLGSGALVADTHPRLMVVPLAWVAGIWLHLRTLRCPNCGNPVYRRLTRMFGVTWTYFSAAFPRRQCSRCGFDLSSRQDPALRAKVSDRAHLDKLGDTGPGFIRLLPIRKVVVVLIAGIVINALVNMAILLSGPRPDSPAWMSWGRWTGAAASALAAGWLMLIRCRRCNQRLGWGVASARCWNCGQDLRQRPRS